MAGENGSHDGPDSVFEAPPKEPARDGKDTDSSALDENSEWAQVCYSINVVPFSHMHYSREK